MENIRIKDKYLIYDSKGNILTFRNLDGRDGISVPTITKEGLDVYSVNDFYSKIISMLSKPDVEFIKEFREKQNIFEHRNGHLIKAYLEVVRNYLICLKDFDEDELDKITLQAKDFSLVPTFNSVSKLKQINTDESIYLDKYLVSILDTVEDKISKKI